MTYIIEDFHNRTEATIKSASEALYFAQGIHPAGGKINIKAHDAYKDISTIQKKKENKSMEKMLSELISNAKTYHTPRPWAVSRDDGKGIAIKGRLEGVRCAQYIATILYDDTVQRTDLPYIPSHKEAQANARLIAAAPDLLAALEGLLHKGSSGIDEPWIDAAREAIKKARGA